MIGSTVRWEASLSNGKRNLGLLYYCFKCDLILVKRFCESLTFKISSSFVNRKFFELLFSNEKITFIYNALTIFNPQIFLSAHHKIRMNRKTLNAYDIDLEHFDFWKL